MQTIGKFISFCALFISFQAHSIDRLDPMNICIQSGGGSPEECSRIVAEELRCQSIEKEERISLATGAEFFFFKMSDCSITKQTSVVNVCFKEDAKAIATCNDGNSPLDGMPNPPPTPWGCYCCAYPDKCNG